MPRRENYRYPLPDGGEFATVEILTKARALSSVHGLLGVIQAGYEAQFEQGDHACLDPGTVAWKYEPNLANMRRYSAYTRGHYEEKNSQIAVVHSSIGNGIEAFAKVTPVFESEDGTSKGVYLNDVIARQHGKGMGSMALHAVLTKTGVPQDAILLLEAFEDSPVNEWYRRLKLEPMPDIPRGEFDFGNERSLPLLYYGTPIGVGIGDVVATLEASHPNLALSQPA